MLIGIDESLRRWVPEKYRRMVLGANHISEVVEGLREVKQALAEMAAGGER